MTQRTDANGTATWAYSTGAAGTGLPSVATDPASGIARSYQFTPAGDVSKITFGSTGLTRSYAFDAAGRLTSDVLAKNATTQRAATAVPCACTRVPGSCDDRARALRNTLVHLHADADGS